MLSKLLFLLLVVFLIPSARAETKTVPLEGGGAGAVLSFHPPDPLVRPTGTAVILCGAEKTGALEKVLLDDLARAGCVGFALKHPGTPLARADVTKAFAHIQARTNEYRIRKEKLGLLVLGASGELGMTAEPFAFLGLMDADSWPELKNSSRPVFLQASHDKASEAWRCYAAATRSQIRVDLHLHQGERRDGPKSTQWMDWLESLGFLKPLSEEKTEALKQKEAWANLAKFYEERARKDWAWLGRYAGDNAKLAAAAAGEKRVVFLGDSITEGWISASPEFFKANRYLNRGIGGQTTPQLLVRFREDVLNLEPKVVIILAGINDIAENTGPSKIENVAGNIFSMCEMARAHGCRPILCSVLPAKGFPWHPGIDPVPTVLRLNALLKNYANSNHLAYVDYYSVTVADDQGMKKELAKDGVHPNLAGYKLMEPLAKNAIDQALAE